MMKRLSSAIKGLSAILLAFSLVSCSDTDGPPEDLIGTVVSGEPALGTVYVVDANGVELSEEVGLSGTFKVDVRKKTAPFMLKFVTKDGLVAEQFSYTEESDALVNITPLTSLAIFVANGNADPAILYNNWSSTFVTITPEIVTNAQAIVNANLLTQFTAFSLDPLTYDFFGTAFAANGTSIDGLLDATTVDISAGFADISVLEVGNIVFNTGINVSGYDIGGAVTATTGAYTVTIDISVAGVTSTAATLSVNLPASYLPADGNTVMVEDMFKSFYGILGAITINSATVTGDTAETVIVLDATITIDSSDVNYIATYTYTENI